MEDNKILSSKCQNCGSNLVYNPKLACLSCKHCEANIFLPKTNDKAILVRQYTAKLHQNQLNQYLRAYRCNACANIYYMSSEEKSEKCPNCGNSSSTMVQDPGYCADGIIPFKISYEEAYREFKKYARKKGVKVEHKDKNARANLSGVFIPVWNFQFNVDAAYSASATELKKYSDGTYYSVYKPVYGEKHKRIKSLDQSATSAETDEFLQLFDEQDYANIIPYTPEYTFGYSVDHINRSIHDYYYQVTETAEKEMKNEIHKKVLNSYKEVSNISVDCRASDVFFNFTYIPVYINTYTKKGKVYKTYISGTTGKVISKNPKSAGHVLGSFVKFALIVALIYFMYKMFFS